MDVVVNLAGPADDIGIRALVRNQTLPGRISLALPRDPDFSLGCAVTGREPRIVVARAVDDGAIVGVACRSVRDVFVNGQPQRIGYLGQLRIDERFRGRWLVARGFSVLAQIHREDPLPAYLVSIVDGNPQATGVLVGKRRRCFPVFHEVARYQTLALTVRRAASKSSSDRGIEIVPGTVDQLPALARFLQREGARRQFGSVWTEDDLRRVDALGLRVGDIRIARAADRIVGVVALWDQSGYKQTIVRGYSGWLRAVVPLTSLPRAGEQIRSAYASLVCVAQDDPVVFGRLLREVYHLACTRRFDYLLVGLDVRDPLMSVARAYAHVAYPSRFYLGTWSSRTTGDLQHDQLDDRPAYVDIATL